MADAKLRHAIAFEAARLMYDRVETEYFTAKLKAAKRLTRGYVKPADLPSNAEIRELVQHFARTYEGDRRTANLKQMRFHALRMMKLLCRFRPRLIGSVMTGHTRQGSDIDLHLFTDHVEAITNTLDTEGLQYDIERKQVTKHGESRVFTHIHLYDTFNFELTVYADNLAHFVFKSSITGKAIERASIAELEQILATEYPDTNPDDELAEQSDAIDPYQMFRVLLMPLENVKQSPKWHPEGDALYHSLQVFERAKDVAGYDEEFLLAALLHDVGKAIDPYDHVPAALQSLEGFITDRIAFLIEHHMLAHEYKAGTLGARGRKRLEESEHFDDLLLLQECDANGRVPGASVGTVDEALEFIRDVERQNRGK
jgi:HD domain